MIRLLLLCIVLLGAGCKSTKKLKQRTYAQQEQSSQSFELDSSIVLSAMMELRKEEVTTTEEIEETYRSLDSAGIVVLKPVRITRRTSTSVREDSSSSEASDSRYSERDSSSSSISQSDTYALDKGSEGARVIEQAAAALFPTWGKILASILIAVVPVFWAYWKKKQNLD